MESESCKSKLNTFTNPIMFPFHEISSSDLKVENEGRAQNNNIEVGYNEVSSSNDIFNNIQSLEDIDLDDYDPSLFCPDIILELGETPIFINSDQDGNCNGLEDPLLTEKNKPLNATFHFTEEEKKLKRKIFGSDNPVQYTKIHCTACNDHLGSALAEHGNCYVHPLLKVLICKECYDFYTSGEFEKEEDGSEMYCRWCGQGGNVMCCSKCQFVFCTTCIRSNLGRKKLTEIKESDDWTCFNCDPSQLIELRVHCAEFMEYVQKELRRMATLANSQSFMNIDYSKCCTKSNSLAIEKKRKKRSSSLDDKNYNPYDNENSRKTSSSTRNNLLTKNSNKIPSEANPSTSKQIKIQSDVQMPIVGNRNGAANVDIKQKSELVDQAPFKPLKPSDFYPPPLKLHEIKILPKPQLFVPGNNKIQASRTIPSYVSFQKPNRAQHNIRVKKSYYENVIRSVSRINSDLSSDLMQVTGGNTGKDLESMVVAHNKLQDVLNKSINSLFQLQRELANCKPGNLNNKPVQVAIMKTLQKNSSLNNCGGNNRRIVMKSSQHIHATITGDNKENKILENKK